MDEFGFRVFVFVFFGGLLFLSKEKKNLQSMSVVFVFVSKLWWYSEDIGSEESNEGL